MPLRSNFDTPFFLQKCKLEVSNKQRAKPFSDTKLGSISFEARFLMFFRPPLFKCESPRHAVLKTKLADMTSMTQPIQMKLVQIVSRLVDFFRSRLLVAPVFKKFFNPGIMPGSRCVVFGCNNTRDDKGGISIHSCPADKCLRAKWVTFVQLHRKDFFRKGSFPVCSAHFSPTAFQRAIHIKGQQRNLIKGAVPTIFKPKQTLSPISQRSRRKVSCVFILFIVFP